MVGRSYCAGWRRSNPSDEQVYNYKGVSICITYKLAGQHTQAEQQFIAAKAQLEDYVQETDRAAAYIALGESFAGLEQRDEAIRWARLAMELVPTSIDAVVGPAIQLDAVLRVFIPASDYDAAFDELDRYLGTRGAEWTIEGLLPDPRLNPIRDGPRFLALVEKYRRQ